MATINRVTKEINFKIVYYGPGMSGKTTNLKFLHRALPTHIAGEMISLDTREERTLFFDFLPMEVGEINGFKTRFSLYTVPGQTCYEASRELVLRNADGVVFVADSQVGRAEENAASLQSLEENLQKQNIPLAAFPWIIQYNKRDLENILAIPQLQRRLNRYGVNAHEAVARSGQGVFQTIKDISQQVIRALG